MQLSGKAMVLLRTGATHHLLMKESVLVQKGLSERVVMKIVLKAAICPSTIESCISIQSHLQPTLLQIFEACAHNKNTTFCLLLEEQNPESEKQHFQELSPLPWCSHNIQRNIFSIGCQE